MDRYMIMLSPQLPGIHYNYSYAPSRCAYMELVAHCLRDWLRSYFRGAPKKEMGKVVGILHNA